jgi:hypothetical protein
MKKFTVIEWHEWQPLLLVILGVALVNIFDDKIKQMYLYLWVILFILCLIPFVWVFIRRMFKKIKIDTGRMYPQDFIDAFDNEIVHNIYNLESLCAKLSETLSNNNTHTKMVSKDLTCFYYIQTSSFFQRTITCLIPINNIASVVLSYNNNDTAIYGRIPFPRYRNISNLLTTIYKYLETHKNIIEELDEGKLIIELNKNAIENLNIIDSVVSKNFENNALNGVK